MVYYNSFTAAYLSKKPWVLCGQLSPVDIRSNDSQPILCHALMFEMSL